MKLHQKILIKILVGIAVFSAIAFGSSFVSSLIQGKTPGEAVQILAEQMGSLVERVNVLEIMQSEGGIRTEVLEAGFQNIDEFRRRYESAKEVCEASDEELKEKVFEIVKWGDPCRTEDGYNELVFSRPEEVRQKYPNKIGDLYCPPEGVEYGPGGRYTHIGQCGGKSGEVRDSSCKEYRSCIEEATYNEVVFSTPQEWQQKYSEKIGSYRCDPQKLNEMIAGYRENEFYDQGAGGCNLAEKYKELYQNVMKSGL